MKLALNALIKFLSGLIILGLLLFLPAGSLRFPNAWLFLALLFVPMLFLGLWLLLKAPALLEKRLESRESEAAQKRVVAVSALAFILSFVLAGLDYRFGWSSLPRWLIGLAALVQLGSYVMYAAVMKQNAYLSRTVKVQEGQQVVDRGLYAVVRHPMYTATVLMFLAMPLVLGSWPAFAVMLLYPVVIVQRIKNEEKLLSEGLAGYREYTARVKYRLIPFVW